MQDWICEQCGHTVAGIKEYVGHSCKDIMRGKYFNPRQLDNLTNCIHLDKYTGKEIQTPDAGKISEYTCALHGLTVLEQTKIRHNCYLCRKNNLGYTVGSFASRYITTEELITDTKRLIPEIIDRPDIIVGIARSGLIPASILATHFHCPLLTIDIKNRTVTDIGGGVRTMRNFITDKTRLLLVDDSSWSGHAFKNAIAILKSNENYKDSSITKFAPYLSTFAVNNNIIFYKRYKHHYFEWNIANSPYDVQLVYDFDGVLCPDFTAEQDTDDFQYVKAMMQMRPSNIRPYKDPIRIITARLEKYRGITEDWLEKYDYKIDKLIMGPWESKIERSKINIAKWKAEELDKLAEYNNIYIESDINQAIEMSKYTKKKIICNTTGDIFND